MTDKTETAAQPEADGIEVKGCFPTPVIIAQTPMDGEENSRLAKTILAMKRKPPVLHFPIYRDGNRPTILINGVAKKV